MDVYNGRFCVTPEYPQGTYAYFIATDSNLNPVYPFVAGPYFYGQYLLENSGPKSGKVAITESFTTYYMYNSGFKIFASNSIILMTIFIFKFFW